MYIVRCKANHTIDTDRCYTAGSDKLLKENYFVYTNIHFIVTHRYPQTNEHSVSPLVNIGCQNISLK